MKRDGIFGVAGFGFVLGFVLAYCEEDGRLCGACVEEDAGDDDAVGVCAGHGGGAVDRVQRGEAEAHHDGVGASDVDGFGEFVNAGGEEEIFAFSELRVDGCGVVAVGVGYVELRDGDGLSGCGCGVPGDA